MLATASMLFFSGSSRAKASAANASPMRVITTLANGRVHHSAKSDGEKPVRILSRMRQGRKRMMVAWVRAVTIASVSTPRRRKTPDSRTTKKILSTARRVAVVVAVNEVMRGVIVVGERVAPNRKRDGGSVVVPRNNTSRRMTMSEKVYKKITVTGCSIESYEKAIEAAVEKASESLRGLAWFEVTEFRGGHQPRRRSRVPGHPRRRLQG
jgi:flavin-binding protein dodecin